MNTSNPDALHPLKAHAVMIEAALGIPHDSKIQELLLAARIPSNRWLLEEEAPISVDMSFADSAKGEQLLRQLQEDFETAFSRKRRRKSVDPSRYSELLKHIYGLEDGIFRPIEDLSQRWNLSRNQLILNRSEGLNQIQRQLASRLGVTVTLMTTNRPLIDAVRASFLP